MLKERLDSLQSGSKSPGRFGDDDVAEEMTRVEMANYMTDMLQ